MLEGRLSWNLLKSDCVLGWAAVWHELRSEDLDTGRVVLEVGVR